MTDTADVDVDGDGATVDVVVAVDKDDVPAEEAVLETAAEDGGVVSRGAALG